MRIFTKQYKNGILDLGKLVVTRYAKKLGYRYQVIDADNNRIYAGNNKSDALAFVGGLK